ncbi:MAG: division/cell wall cluster transcriptional repressor MraZ [Patescibacteria group bacterium]
MFIGEYQYSIDDKKRLSIPSKFRKGLGKIAIVTRGLDGCLFLYPQEEWKKLAEKLGKLPLGQADARGFQRIMLSGAMEASIDNLGRILIPDYLKKYASLQRRVMIVGLYNHIELWNDKRWKDYQKKSEKEVGNMAERLSQLGV